MTDIDPQADIELHPADGHVTVSVPLAGAVTGDWLRCYQKLALAAEVPVQAQARHDRAWIVVSVPVTSDHGEVAATLHRETGTSRRAPPRDCASLGWGLLSSAS